MATRIRRLNQTSPISTVSNSRDVEINNSLTKVRDISNALDRVISKVTKDKDITKPYVEDLVYLLSELLRLSYKTTKMIYDKSGSYKGKEVLYDYYRDLDNRYNLIQSKLDSYINNIK